MLKGGFITCLEKIEPANLLGVKSQKAVKGKFDQTFIAILNLLFAQLDNPNINNSESNSIPISGKQAQFRLGFSNLEEKKELLSTLLEELEAILQEPITLKGDKTFLSILKNLKEKLVAFTHSDQIKTLITALVNICSHHMDKLNTNPLEENIEKRLENIIHRLQDIIGEKAKVYGKEIPSETSFKELNPKAESVKSDKGLTNRNENPDSEFEQKLLSLKEPCLDSKKVKLTSSLPQIQETQKKSLEETGLIKTQFNSHETKGEIEVKVPLPPKEEVKTNIEPRQETDKTIITSTQPKIDIHVSQLERTDSPQGPHYLDKSNVLDQIAKGVHIQLKAGKKEATIQLEPPSLGKLHIKVGIENGVVKVHFIAAYHTTKEFIEANLASLRQTLLQQGVQVGEFSVALGGQQLTSSGNREGKENSEQREPGEKEITPIKAVEEKRPFSSTGEIDFWA